MTRRWDFISIHRAEFGVKRICQVLPVSRSGFCRWLAGAKAREIRQAAEDSLVAEIREVHAEHKGTYGVRRVHAELRGFGHTSTASASSGSCGGTASRAVTCGAANAPRPRPARPARSGPRPT